MNPQLTNNNINLLGSVDSHFDLEGLSKSIREATKSLEDFVRIQSDISALSMDISKILDGNSFDSSFNYNPFETLSSIGNLSSAPTTINVDNSGSFSDIKDSFTSLLKSTSDSSEDIDQLESLFSSFLKQDKGEALDFLSKTFMYTMENDGDYSSIQVAILRLICRYDYQELSPHAQLIAGNARTISSLAVKSATFDVYDHWSNIPAYNILTKMDKPIELWLKMKYDALIDSIAEKYAIRKETK